MTTNKTGVNEDLVKERAGVSFNVDGLTYILDGGKQKTRRRRKLQNELLDTKGVLSPTNFHYMSRSEQHSEAVRKQFLLFKYLLDDNIKDYMPSLITITHPNEAAPFLVHPLMFVPMIISNASDEQMETWLPQCVSLEMIGTYAQTEMGHGTHLRGLETTATYDPGTEEFVIHNPTISSMKWWPGTLGKSCNHAIVMAQLHTDGQGLGMHAFLVPLRDTKTHQPLPGIEIGDIGPKYGYSTMDNGFLKFDHFRIPRTNMLMKYNQVTPEGKYIRADASAKRQSYSVMILTRIRIVVNTAQGLGQATTIAVRYSAVRRGISLSEGPEPQILDYQTQQYKLLPVLATAYVYILMGQEFDQAATQSYEEIVGGDTTSVAALHALSAGLKALATQECIPRIDQCRMACGGHGFSDASGMSKIYTYFLPGSTYEGENTVLYLQTARYLMKMLGSDEVKQSATLQYLADTAQPRPLSHKFGLDELVSAYQHRAKLVVGRAAQRVEANQRQGAAVHDAWNLATVDLVNASQAHCLQYVIQTTATVIHKVTDPSIATVLSALCQLYAVDHIINNSADFIEAGCISPEGVRVARGEVLSLLATLRPDAVGLVDAFDYTDHQLGSALGCYDGHVYQRLWEFAKSNPLNEHQVHPAYQHLRPHMANL